MRHDRRLVSGQTLTVALVGVAGTLSALAWSGRPSYWFDEAATISAAGRSITRLGPLLLRTDAVHGLYYAAMHLTTMAATMATANSDPMRSARNTHAGNSGSLGILNILFLRKALFKSRWAE